MKQFQVEMNQFGNHRIENIDLNMPEAGSDEMVVKVEKFGFSANNVTYAAAGDRLGYWQFFPPIGSDIEGWGVIPVWGFAEIVTSNVEGLDPGERLFGYFPPATHLVMKPQKIADGQFLDGAEHRSQLPVGYNIYRRIEAEPGYDRNGDDLRMLLYPLYLTSYVLWDFLKENDWFGAEQIILGSASSKTAIGLAYALHGDDEAPDVVGLTSARNVEFVQEIGIYDSCIQYDEIESRLENKPSVIVDMSGNSGMIGGLHAYLGDNMLRTSNVGITHWEDFKPDDRIIRDRSEFFFAPSQIQKRIKEWGAEEFGKRSSGFVFKTAMASNAWLNMCKLEGVEGLAGVYEEVLSGNQDPRDGLLIYM